MVVRHIEPNSPIFELGRVASCAVVGSMLPSFAIPLVSPFYLSSELTNSQYIQHLDMSGQVDDFMPLELPKHLMRSLEPPYQTVSIGDQPIHVALSPTGDAIAGSRESLAAIVRDWIQLAKGMPLTQLAFADFCRDVEAVVEATKQVYATKALERGAVGALAWVADTIIVPRVQRALLQEAAAAGMSPAVERQLISLRTKFDGESLKVTVPRVFGKLVDETTNSRVFEDTDRVSKALGFRRIDFVLAREDGGRVAAEEAIPRGPNVVLLENRRQHLPSAGVAWPRQDNLALDIRLGKSRGRASTTEPEFGNGRSDEDNIIAWLLAGFDSDRTEWSDDVVAEINGNRARSLFFCPILKLLERRGKTLERITRKYDDLKTLKFQKRTVNILARQEPATLDMVLHVYRVLKAIGTSSHKDARAVTRVLRRGQEVCLILEEDDVIPSHYWLDPHEFVEFRAQFNVTKRQFAALMFDKERFSYFFDKLASSIKGNEYDFRVTPFTKDRILYTLCGLFYAAKDRLRNSNYELPDSDLLFSGRPNVGLGAYNRTKALPLSYGNQTRPLSKGDKEAIDLRIKAFVATMPMQIAPRDRSDWDTEGGPRY